MIRRASPIRLLSLGVIVGLVAGGCRTTRPGASDASESLSRAFSPIFEIGMLRSGRFEMLYALGSFYRRNHNWPDTYAQLREFVDGSNGYLILGDYRDVQFDQHPDASLNVSFTRPGSTNQTSFTIEDKGASK